MKWIDKDYVDVTSTAEEAGIGFDALGAPVALTKRVWNDCVEWTDTDSDQQDFQEQDARLWDVVFTCGGTLQLGLTEFFKAGQHDFSVRCVPRDGKATNAITFRLSARPRTLGDTIWMVIDFTETDGE